MKIEKTVKEYNMLPPKARVLCALSGGADSVAMTAWLAENAKKLNITVAASHFSHGIRIDAAEAEKQLCKKLCDELKIEIFFGEGNSVKYAKEHKLSLEEGARELRYAFFNRVADEWNADRIATAHHANDNVETVIINACRGAGVAGLMGIPAVRDRFIRPLIETEKSEIEAYIIEKNLKFATDITNFQICCKRNEIRLVLLPQIRGAYPDADKLLTRFSRQARVKNDEIICKANMLVGACDIKENEIVACAEKLRNAEDAVLARVIQYLYKNAGGNIMLTSRHIESVKELLSGDNPSARVSLPQITAKRQYDKIIFSKPVSNPFDLPKIIRMGQTVSFGLWETEIVSGKKDNALWLDGSKLPEEMFLRMRKEGDSILLGGHRKSLKKLMIEKKIPKDDRGFYPVLTDGESIIAIPEIGKSDDYAFKADKDIVSVIFRRINR